MFIFLLTPGKFLTNNSIEEMETISKHLEQYDDLLYPEVAKQMIYTILNDGFTDETKSKSRNEMLLKKLNKLKSETVDFYLQSLSDNKINNPTIKYNSDLYTKMGEYLLQILRFRMVIQPEIQITTNVHKITKIKYITVKGFWLNDSGEKERKFSKSLGRADEYQMGKDDLKVIEDGTKKMQSIILNEYLNHYPEK